MTRTQARQLAAHARRHKPVRHGLFGSLIPWFDDGERRQAEAHAAVLEALADAERDPAHRDALLAGADALITRCCDALICDGVAPTCRNCGEANSDIFHAPREVGGDRVNWSCHGVRWPAPEIVEVLTDADSPLTAEQLGARVRAVWAARPHDRRISFNGSDVQLGETAITNLTGHGRQLLTEASPGWTVTQLARDLIALLDGCSPDEVGHG